MATVKALAELVGGTVVGDGSRQISDLSDLQNAGPEHLSFLANPKYRPAFDRSKAGAIVVAGDIERPHCTLIVCANPYLAMATIAQHLHPAPRFEAGIHRGAFVHDEAKVAKTAVVRAGAVVEAYAEIGEHSVIGPGAYVGIKAKIGRDCHLHAGVHVLERCVVGNQVILHAGVVIGSDGFGYAPDFSGKRHKIPQVGIVRIDDDVEIGANSTVDRATFGTTRIGRGSKIDNLVQIAHNVVIGEDCVLASQTGVAGSTTLGNRVVVGAQAGIVGHIQICDDVMLGARAGVTNSVSEPGIYSGAPLQPHREWRKTVVAQKEVPELRRRLRELEARVKRLNNDA